MFEILFTNESLKILKELQKNAEIAASKAKSKSSLQEGFFKQVKKTLKFLSENPRHPSLNTHEYSGLKHPWDSKLKVFEAYAQNRTPGAYRVFWCYGPGKTQITIITIVQHP